MKLHRYFLVLICAALSQSFALEMFHADQTTLPLEISECTALQSVDLINEYQHKLYSSEQNSDPMQAAKALFFLFTKFQNIKAIDSLGDFYYDDQGEFETGILLYQAGVSINSPHCMFKLARIYLSENKKEDALSLLRQGARLYDNYCLCLLAQKILDQTFPQFNHLDAKKLFEISAQQGFTVAITELAKYYTDKKYGIPHYLLAYMLLSTIKSDNRARQDLAKIADKEVIRLYKNKDFLSLAERYYAGHNTPKNDDLAIGFIKAAYTRKNISTLETRYYITLIRQNKPWEEPSSIDLVLIKIF